MDSIEVVESLLCQLIELSFVLAKYFQWKLLRCINRLIETVVLCLLSSCFFLHTTDPTEVIWVLTVLCSIVVVWRWMYLSLCVLHHERFVML